MRHVNETRQGKSPRIGERFRSFVGVVEFRTTTNRNGEWCYACKKCALNSAPCGFVECMLAYRSETDRDAHPCLGYYVKIEEGEK